MNHPNLDSKLRALVGSAPSTDFIWCDECLHWELTRAPDGRLRQHTPPKLGFVARLWSLLADGALKLFTWASERQQWAQVKHLVRTGRIVSKGH